MRLLTIFTFSILLSSIQSLATQECYKKADGGTFCVVTAKDQNLMDITFETDPLKVDNLTPTFGPIGIVCLEGQRVIKKGDGSTACVAQDGAIVQTKDGNKFISSKTCEQIVEKTKTACTGAKWSQYSGMAVGLASTLAQMKSQGNIKGACEAAQKITSLNTVANASVASMCAKSVISCKEICKKEKETSEPCSEFEKYAELAGMQSIESATAYIGSSACANAVSGQCVGDDAANNEDCVQFCLKPGRQDHPKCKIALNNCGDATYASQNLQYCTCVNNPFAPNCSTLTGTDPIPGTGTSPTAPSFDDALGSSDYDFTGATGEGKPATVNTPSGGGSGFDGGGGGSSAIGSNDGNGTGDDPLSKDILSGTGSGSAVGAVYGGGGYNEASGGSGKSGSGFHDSNGIDLRAFLPGGKKDPRRNPASAGYIDPTITKANGLTNFQKVTRKMNEKRPELMP